MASCCTRESGQYHEVNGTGAEMRAALVDGPLPQETVIARMQQLHSGVAGLDADIAEFVAATQERALLAAG